LLILSIHSHAQILGGGPLLSNAITFNPTWITACPGGGATLSNQSSFEPATAMDPCAPAPACATGTTGSDVWFSFFAQATTATIVAEPSASFDIGIQAFSGSTCPGLVNIGCIDANGNNTKETLVLSGLTINTLYYFRIFGATNNAANRTGTYTFCGSTSLGGILLPVEILDFKATTQNDNAILSWTTAYESNNSHFEIERSANGNQFENIGRLIGKGTTSQTNQYNFTDYAPQLGTNFYRLKQVDYDGKYKYSKILNIVLDNKQKQTITVSPNPVSDKFNIRVSADAPTNASMSVMNSTGQLLYQQNTKLVKGENLLAINNLQGLSNGLYTLQLLIDGKKLSTKFVFTK
jgi:Secretion system C-terminal sorting domain